MREQSQRQLRVGEQLRHIISQVLRNGHFHDELLLDKAGEVTVTEVKTSPDLRNATAYVIALGGKDMDEMLPALNNAAPYFQKEISRNMSMKFTPRIRFTLDNSFEEAGRIDAILQKLPKKNTQTE